jgi:hypothetical protein
MMTGQKTLFVEVDATGQPALFGFLQVPGYDCVPVSAGEALEALANHDFGFTFIDLSSFGPGAHTRSAEPSHVGTRSGLRL